MQVGLTRQPPGRSQTSTPTLRGPDSVRRRCWSSTSPRINPEVPTHVFPNSLSSYNASLADSDPGLCRIAFLAGAALIGSCRMVWRNAVWYGRSMLYNGYSLWKLDANRGFDLIQYAVRQATGVHAPFQ